MNRAPSLFGLMCACALSACSGGSSTGAAGTSSTGSSGPSATTGTNGGGSTSGGSDIGDTTAGAGPLELGSLCQISILDTPGNPGDPCAAAGLACNLDVEGYDHCTLPEVGQGCEASVGCAADGICFDRNGASRCYQGCSQTADCAQSADVCAVDGGSVCAPDVCTTLYVACDSDGTGNGVCLPVQSSSDGIEGLCFSTGQAALDTPCSATRGNAGALCAAGTQCLQLASGMSFCAPVCASSALKDAGPGAISTNCAASDLCLSLGGDLEFGACLTNCTNGASCPGDLQCVPDATTGAGGASVSLCL